MSERFFTGYNDFVLPFLFGFGFVLLYCVIGAIRTIAQLPPEDKRKFFLSLVNPKILLKDIKDIFLDCLIHPKLWRRNKLLGYMHFSIAFGWFMLIVIGHIEVYSYFPHRAIYPYYPIFFRFFTAETESTVGGSFLFFLMDFFLALVLSGILLAIFKRITSRVFGLRRTTNPSFLDLVGLYSLWSIFPLRLLAESFTAHISGGSFLTKSMNHLFANFLGDYANMLPTWWAYSFALCIFFCVLPFTRYMHIPAEILLIPLRNAGVKISHARKGYAITQVNSCPSCGLCIDACPMGVMRTHIKDSTVYLNRQIRRGNESNIAQISEKCLLCGKCTAICPVGVQGDSLRIAQRSVRQYFLSPNYSNIDTGVLIENNSLVSLSQEKVLYFAGCMTALTPQISKAVTSVLAKAGVDCAFMDKEGGICCGRPMWMAGRLEQAKQMMEKNTEIIRASGAKTLLLSCPLCYRIFKEKYDLEGIEVVHHTEFFDRLIREGRLSPRRSDKKFAYHDPCELGRGCGVYDEPRSVIGAVGELVEAAKHHKESICCGGSVGSLTLSYEQREPMTENAIHNLMAGSPDTIVTACPLCLSTFRRYAECDVEDIAQTLDNNLKTTVN